MTDTPDRSVAGRPEEDTARSCPLCGDAVVESQYPRHQLTLADEADAVQNRRVNHRLCQPCWQTLYTALSNDTETTQMPSFPQT